MKLILPIAPNTDNSPLFNARASEWMNLVKQKIESSQSISFGIPIAVPVKGCIPYYSGTSSGWAPLAPGINGQILKTLGTGSNIQWANFASSLSAGYGISIAGTSTATVAINQTPLFAALGSDVALSTTTSYFDGPAIAQGTAGTWFASGTVTLTDTAGAARFNIKLWDGATVISSTTTLVTGANLYLSASLCGYITAPTGNIRISAQDVSSTSGKIIFNQSGLSKDSHIAAIRLA